MRASLCGNCAHSVLEGIVPCGVIPVSSFVCKVIKSTEELPEVSLKNEHPHACLLLFAPQGHGAVVTKGRPMATPMMLPLSMACIHSVGW